MIFALVVVLVFGIALFGGYKWGSHEATENAIEVFESHLEEENENVQGPYNITPTVGETGEILESEQPDTPTVL